VTSFGIRERKPFVVERKQSGLNVADGVREFPFNRSLSPATFRMSIESSAYRWSIPQCVQFQSPELARKSMLRIAYLVTRKCGTQQGVRTRDSPAAHL